MICSLKERRKFPHRVSIPYDLLFPLTRYALYQLFHSLFAKKVSVEMLNLTCSIKCNKEFKSTTVKRSYIQILKKIELPRISSFLFIMIRMSSMRFVFRHVTMARMGMICSLMNPIWLETGKVFVSFCCRDYISLVFIMS